MWYLDDRKIMFYFQFNVLIDSKPKKLKDYKNVNYYKLIKINEILESVELLKRMETQNKETDVIWYLNLDKFWMQASDEFKPLTCLEEFRNNIKSLGTENNPFHLRELCIQWKGFVCTCHFLFFSCKVCFI